MPNSSPGNSAHSQVGGHTGLRRDGEGDRVLECGGPPPLSLGVTKAPAAATPKRRSGWWLGLIAAVVAIGCLWLLGGLGPFSPAPQEAIVSVEINGTDESPTDGDWPVCTLRNLTGREVYYSVEISCDPMAKEANRANRATNPPFPAIQATWRRVRYVSTIAYDGTRAIPYETLCVSGQLDADGKTAFVPSLPPGQRDLELTVAGVCCTRPSKLHRTLHATEAAVRRWFGLSAPPWIRLQGRPGTIRQTFRLTASATRRRELSHDASAVNYPADDGLSSPALRNSAIGDLHPLNR